MRVAVLCFFFAAGVAMVASAKPCEAIIERHWPLFELTPNSLIDTTSTASLHFEDALPFAAKFDPPVLTRVGAVIHVLQSGTGSYATAVPTCVDATLSAGTTSNAGQYKMQWDYQLAMNDGTTFTARREEWVDLDRSRPDITITPPFPRTSSAIIVSATGTTATLSEADVPRMLISGSSIRITIDSYEGPLEMVGRYSKQVSLPPLPAGRYDVEVLVRHLWFDRVCCYYAASSDRRAVSFFVTADPAVPAPQPRRRVALH